MDAREANVGSRVLLGGSGGTRKYVSRKFSEKK